VTAVQAACQATAIPKTADGMVEMIRQVKVAKDVAVKARTAAIISLKQVIVNAPPEQREELQPLSKMALINRCARLRPGQVTTLAASTKYTLRAIARRWQQLNTEISAHEKVLAELTRQAAPDLSAAFAVGPDTAAEMLIVAGRRSLRAGVCEALRSRTDTSLVGDDHPPSAQPRRTPTSQRRALPRCDRAKCNITSPPRPTSPAAPPRARPKPRSSAA